MMRILVFEDDSRIAYAYKRGLSRLGQVEVFTQPELGLHRIHEADLIVTDLDMPGMGGLGLLRHLHQERVTAPIIVASGSRTISEARGLATHILRKPFGLVELLSLIKQLSQPAAFDNVG